MSPNKSFALLFKKLRLQAGIATLTELGELLANKGFIYEDSSLSHWQSGRKVPKRRELLLALVSIFVESNSDILISDLNNFLESSNQGYLTEKEIKMLNIKKSKLYQSEKVKHDWGEAPDTNVFFGRTEELKLLRKWILFDSCRLVGIVGMRGVGKTRLSIKLGRGGIGKTDLSLKFARDIEKHFDYVIWRRLLNAPKLTELILDLVKFFSNQKEVTLPDKIDEQISRLLYYLRKKRCLVVLDNVETILQGGRNAGQYISGYEEYGQLFSKIAQSLHKSCLLLTSREKQPEISNLESKTGPVRLLELNGLDVVCTRKIFSEIGTFLGSNDEWQKITDIYNGNPLALELAARHIKEVFFGKLTDFFNEGRPLFSDLSDLLDWHFNRLSYQHKEIMYWLAINREPTSFDQLKEDIPSLESRVQLSSTLQSLQKLIPIEKNSQGFTLQPVLIEYMTEKLIEQIVKEIKDVELNIFQSHALLKTSVDDYVRLIQGRLIIKPIVEQLIETYKDKIGLEERFKEILVLLRKQSSPSGYAAGNILNLLTELNYDLAGYDFSHLPVWQAYLKGKTASNVNFSYAHFLKSVFTDTFGSSLCVAFSPKEDVLASGMATGEIRFWSASTGLPLKTIQEHTDWVWSIAFSPNGEMLASCSGDHTVRLWEAKSGKLINILEGHTGIVYTVAFSPDGSTLASSSDDNTVRIWDIKTKKLLETLSAHSSTVYSVAFSPNGKMLASCGVDKIISLWDLKTKKVTYKFKRHTEWIRQIVFSPDGKMLISCSGDKTVRLWDVNSGKLLNTLYGHENWVWAVAVSPDGKLIASGSEDKTIRLWDAKSCKCVSVLQSHTGAVYSLSFSRNGSIIASCGVDKTIRLWDVNNHKLLNSLYGYTNRSERTIFSPDGEYLISGHEDHTVRIWKVDTGELLKTLKGHKHWIWAVAVSPDGKLIASGSEDKTIRLWDANNGNLKNVLDGHNHWVYSLVFTPDSKTLISSGGDKMIRLWDAQTGENLNTLKGHDHWVWTIALSPDGKIIASGSYDKTVRIWEVETGKCINVLQGHNNWISSVAFSPDGKLIASGSGDKTIRLWSAKNGKLIGVLNHNNEVSSVAFSPDGKLIASGNYDQMIHTWEIETMQKITTLKNHDHWVSSVAFHPNNKMLVSGGYDGAINLWDLKDSTKIRTLRVERPYELMNITQVKGLTNTQKEILKSLGAIE